MTGLPPRLLLATNNAGKLAEFRESLGPLGCAVMAQGELAIAEAEEPFDTFLENALAKARHASALAGLPALADDSGLCVSALHGAPGVHSARFGGLPRSDARNNAALLAALHGAIHRDAFFVCTLVLLEHPEDPDPLVAQGRWYGTIATSGRGEHGHGYDPLFELPTHESESLRQHWLLPTGVLSAAQLPLAAKQQLSHRAKALQALLQALERRGALP